MLFNLRGFMTRLFTALPIITTPQVLQPEEMSNARAKGPYKEMPLALKMKATIVALTILGIAIHYELR
jgi:hypothetical protein